jgi:hypothetical protein
MSGGYYILENKTPVPCDDVIAWGRWFGDIRNRRVAFTKIGPMEVSTVFLGLDHSFGDGAPMLFETMTFCDDDIDWDCQRCATWDEAEEQHRQAVRHAKRCRRERRRS